jgi:MFS family permease
MARLLDWDRDFGIFFCTQGVSNIGDAAWGVLIPLYVLQLTHDPLQVSAVAVVEVVAFALLRIPFGALADRYDSRRLMLAADFGRTFLTLAVPLVSLLHGPVLVVVYAVILPDAALSSMFDGASGSAVPMLVPENARPKAYAWQESFESVAWVVGPPAGGLLAVAFGTGPALALDSVTFLVSVAGLAVIRTRFAPGDDAGPEALVASMWSGLRLMISNRVLRRDQLIWGMYSILGSGIVLGLVYVGTRGGTSGGVSATLAVAAYAAGSAVGTLAAGKVGEGARNPWRAAAAGLLVAAVGAGLVAVGATWAILVGAAAFGVGEGFLLVVHLTVRAGATPDGYFGRITGVAGVAGEVTNGLSMVWLGLALRLAHATTTFIVLGVALLVLGVSVVLSPAPSPDLRPEGPYRRRSLVALSFSEQAAARPAPARVRPSRPVSGSPGRARWSRSPPPTPCPATARSPRRRRPTAPPPPPAAAAASGWRCPCPSARSP